MIKAHYLKSDFDPKILILGDQSEFIQLKFFFTDFLNQNKFKADLNNYDIQQSNFQLTSTKNPAIGKGLFQQGDELVLDLNYEQIEKYLYEIEGFLSLEADAGSCVLDLLVIDEIRIQLSFGEFDHHYFEGI